MNRKRAARAFDPGAIELNEFEGARAEGFSIPWSSYYPIIPMFAALLVCVNTLRNDFAFDDLALILQNGSIKELRNIPHFFVDSSSPVSLESIWKSDVYFRPVFLSLLSINHAIFGVTPWGWHLVSLLLHIATTLLVFLVCREVSGRNWLALITAVLFAVHPAHAEAVAWASGSSVLLMSLFSLAAFYLYLRHRRAGQKRLLALALGCALLAVLSNETALALPLLIGYWEFARPGESSRKHRLADSLRYAGAFTLPVIA